MVKAKIMKKDPNKYPKGWNRAKVEAVIRTATKASAEQPSGRDEALEDARDLAAFDEAVRENAGKPLVPWEDVKRSLGLNTRATRSSRRKSAPSKSGKRRAA